MTLKSKAEIHPHQIWLLLTSTSRIHVFSRLDQNVAPAQDVPWFLLRRLADVGGDPFEAHDGEDHLPNTWREANRADGCEMGITS